MIVIKFKDFFQLNEKNYQLQATTSTSIQLNEKDKIDVKIGTNSNKFILELEDEDDLIDLFCLNFNSMLDSFVTPVNINIPQNDLIKVTQSIINSMDGLSTHLIKYPEATRASGQLYIKKETLSLNQLIVDSSKYFDGKEKVYSQNATTMKFARPFSCDFKFCGEIISYLEVFSNLSKFEKFEKFVSILFGNLLDVLTVKSKDIISGVTNIFHENTIVDIPVNNQYISLSPLASAKILNGLQYSELFSDSFNIRNTRLSVGGSKPQNASDYFLHISGRQKVLLSVPPKIKVSSQSAKNYVFKLNHGFDKIILSGISFISERVKDKEYLDHINAIFALSRKDKLESFETVIVEKSIFLNNLIEYKLRDLNYVIDNYYFMLGKTNFEHVKYNEKLVHLINHKTKLFLLPEDSDLNIKFNEYIKKYNDNSNNDFDNIENGIINSIKTSIEVDFAKHMKRELVSFEQGFSKLISAKISKILFGDK